MDWKRGQMSILTMWKLCENDTKTDNNHSDPPGGEERHQEAHPKVRS